MLYKPSFCCHCGEKIERADWNIFSSRRFCDVCKEENKGFELLAKLAVVGALMLPLSVAGSLLGTAKDEPLQKTSFVQTNKMPSAPNVKRELDSAVRNSEVINNKGVAASPALPENSTTEIGKQPRNQKITSEGEVFYCGAATKKGTACTRKVKTKGNCWQHSARVARVQ
ncbi:MAG: hypothetical protein WKF92_05730 [Pyrinomonadaceae bacterium]